jgi:hypothetical protein
MLTSTQATANDMLITAQMGNNNVINSTQNGFMLASATISQVGNNNTVNGTQTGGSSTANVGQFGNNNSATYFQNGSGNTVNIMQGAKH